MLMMHSTNGIAASMHAAPNLLPGLASFILFFAMMTLSFFWIVNELLSN